MRWALLDSRSIDDMHGRERLVVLVATTVLMTRECGSYRLNRANLSLGGETAKARLPTGRREQEAQGADVWNRNGLLAISGSVPLAS